MQWCWRNQWNLLQIKIYYLSSALKIQHEEFSSKIYVENKIFLKFSWLNILLPIEKIKKPGNFKCISFGWKTLEALHFVFDLKICSSALTVSKLMVKRAHSLNNRAIELFKTTIEWMYKTLGSWKDSTFFSKVTFLKFTFFSSYSRLYLIKNFDNPLKATFYLGRCSFIYNFGVSLLFLMH